MKNKVITASGHTFQPCSYQGLIKQEIDLKLLQMLGMWEVAAQ